ncbi:E3 ubiquitin-protein ligase RBBP6 isoform X2 [Diorhabda sublineata]|uniref:E3 ubiquitin-protein ligase RBBP6 isoform X2 n=1 Tax=Diorhabda sublineata TaxID=1163346 RepID=UPI0024E128AE|nr:E3 ubiquitin-protein ligase RBBP6 isoform X2 [Diorhabda sublineata]
MSVHYKFKSALEYDTVTFDGLHISVKDLKNAIIQQKRIGKSTDFDLQVTNAQTKEVYEDENALIPKNASLLIARIPIIPQKNKTWGGYGDDNTTPTKSDEGGPIAKEVDLSNIDAPEDDKIRAMMSQSTQDYDPSNYMKIRGANQVGAVPANYKCFKCHQGGHWIKDCTFGMGSDPGEIKKSTGIPRSFMVAVDGPQVPGAMMTPNGQFAVPMVDHQAYNQKPVPMPVQPPKMEIPEELVCSICSDLLTDAVMIPCCGNSFCDECIRGVLLESEDHECPDCHEKEISPDTLIPNRFLRTSVANFKSTTGYVKIPTYREPKSTPVVQTIPSNNETTPPRYTDPEKQTVISEADSTEPYKLNQNPESRIDQQSNEKERTEGPPGVSPRGSPRDRKYREESPRSPRDRAVRSRRRSRSRSISPRRSPRRMPSRSRTASRSPGKRSGTPTVDEPVIPGANSYPPTTFGNTNLGQVAPMQGPPTIPGSFPPIGTFPTQGPPPNYRFPPPGAGPAYMGPSPYVARTMFDGTRPPIGAPPNYPSYAPGSRSHRDYNRRMLDRAPAGVIDDPLAAFNRLLREKDEQKRRAKQRGFRRSYSRSRSRSRSFSRSPIRRRSRSPRAGRRSRSRSRSFSLSRSRNRDYDDDRDYDRNRDSRRIRDRRSSRERDRFFDNYDDKRAGRGQQTQWGQRNVVQDNYFPTPGPQSMQTGYQTNRFGPPFMNKEPPFHQSLPQTIHSIQPQRQYQDIAPPGVDDDIGPPGVEEAVYKSEKKEAVKKEDKPERRKESYDKKRSRHDKRSRTPEKIRSPRRKSKSRERDKDSPDKHRKRRRDSSDKDDDDKSKRSKDKKKHKEKKDSEKKKKRDKKDKHKKDNKEKKSKDEFKQVIPKNRRDEEDDDEDKNIEKKNPEKDTTIASPREGNENEEIENVNRKEESQLNELVASKEHTPERQDSKMSLYEDVVTEIDTNVIENYGRLETNSPFEGRDEGNRPAPEGDEIADLTEDGEIKEIEDEEKDVLELHSNDMDLKAELEKTDILAPVPEISKWEVEDESGAISPKDTNKSDTKTDKNGKVVTSEVLKRAENAIFAKAINAIRNPDVKKTGSERIKKDTEEIAAATVKSDIKPVRISVKDRLGVKVDDSDKIINLSRRSTTVSPFSRRGDGGRNITVGERRIEANDHNKRNRRSRSRRRGSRERTRSKTETNQYNRNISRTDRDRKDRHKKEDRVKSEDDNKKMKKKRSRTRSVSEDKKEKHKKKEKRVKKDKSKKKEDEDNKSEEKDVNKQLMTAKRKATIDEASFEPDYDESHSDIEDESKSGKKKSKKDSEESSSSETESSSSSEEERKKKKRKKHKKKKKRDSSSSSSSSSEESDSSDSEKERKRKKHKKNKKKKKKSKHK